MRIGRATDCNIVIDDDAQVSRHHAEVEVSVGGLVMLRDLGSSNGTRLNGEPLSRATPLQDGDRIGIGGQEITYRADIPVTPFGQTVVAKDLPGAAGQTAVASGTPEGAEVTPTDRPSALRVLDLDSSAGDPQIQQRYRELYSEFQVRLTNAPTAQLKEAYGRRIEDLNKALQILTPQAAAEESSNLPSLKPGGGRRSRSRRSRFRNRCGGCGRPGRHTTVPTLRSRIRVIPAGGCVHFLDRPCWWAASASRFSSG